MFGYRIPAPDEAMLISDGKNRTGGSPFRIVTGHGAFGLPFVRKVRFLTLAMCEAEVHEACVTRQAIALNVRAVIAFKVGNDDESIVTERQKLAVEVLDGSKAEMATLGLSVDSLQIQSIDDMKHGYIAAMAAPHNAAIQHSQRQQAEYARQTAVIQAQYRAQIDTAQAAAAQAGPLAQAQATLQVIAAQTELAQRAAELRQQELIAEVVRPAEAEAERVRILALADAEKMRIQAEAAASNDWVALHRMLLDQLPEIVKQAALGLHGANVNILNGADGLSEIAAGLVSQGLTIL
jgi:hypothetical protein